MIIDKNIKFWTNDFFTKKEKPKEDENSVFFILKNSIHLKNLTNYLNNINEQFGDKIEKVIILDDEGDNASFNTNETKQTDELSKINELISTLIQTKFKFYINFISVTATPFVHFFATNFNNLKPDFVYLLKPAAGYTGILAFNETLNQEKSRVIVPIKNEWDDELLTEDLKKAILTFMLINSWMKNKHNYETRMMINVSHKNDEQELLENEISNWLNGYKNNKEKFTNNIINDNIFDLIGNNDFEYNFISNKENQKKLIDLTFEKYIQISKYELIVYNKDNSFDIKLESKLKNNPQIIIGSFKLSRGITINDLMCVYMSHRPKKVLADVLLQRARWFGYRKKYISQMRIFLTRELIDDYSLIGDMCNNLYYIVERAEEENISFKTIDKFLSVPSANSSFSPVSSNRATTNVVDGNIRNSFMNHLFKEGEISERLKNVFINTWKQKLEKEEKTNYPIIRYESLSDFIGDWFNSNSQFYEAINLKDFQDINQIEDLYLKIPTYVRFINKGVENIKYRDRKILYTQRDNSYYFSNGNYEGEKNIVYSKLGMQMIKIDLLPLRIWKNDPENNEENFRANIFRLKMFLPFFSLEEERNMTGYRGKS